MAKPKQSELPTRSRDSRAGLKSVAERTAFGRSLREQCPPSALVEIGTPSPRRNVTAILRKDSAGRLPDLIPIRYGRMLPSPFAFMRGAVAVMMQDIGRLPHTGINTQLCGDCHVRNFGGFASPEQNLLFGINDFDQTLSGPFEWDLKRLAASIVVSAREAGMREGDCKEAARAAAESYRVRMAEFAQMRTMEVWHYRIEATALVAIAENAKTRRKRAALIQTAEAHTARDTFDKLAKIKKGQPRIRDKPPGIYHLEGVRQFESEVRTFYGEYLKTLPADRRTVLRRFELADVAAKVTGVGSVGLRCAIALLMAGADDPLFLQLKEARRSVLEPFVKGAVRFGNQGLRVVVGQHLMQAATDIFLGWFHEPDLKADFYVRQFNDMKFSVDTSAFLSVADFVDYAQICGWELARAHAKAGDPAIISGYLGAGGAFQKAITGFAVSYADRNESDFQFFQAEVKAGKIHALDEEK